MMQYKHLSEYTSLINCKSIVKFDYDIVQYNVRDLQHSACVRTYRSYFGCEKNTLYCSRLGKLWGVSCEYLKENWPIIMSHGYSMVVSLQQGSV